MMHQHNHSTLLGSKRRSIYYPPDGSGRDSYIQTDNGGTNIINRCQGAPHLGNYMKFGKQTRTFKPASFTRFQKYISDGSGRDKYVISHHGGQYCEDQQNKSLLIKFTNSMRDGGWKKSRNSLYGEFYRPSQVKNTEERRKSQSGTIKKLSEPKRRNLKYSLQLEEMRKSFHPQK